MEEIKDLKNINNKFLGKKTKNIKKIFKIKENPININVNKNKNKIKTESSLFESSTDLSSSNILSLEEKSDTNPKIHNFDDIIIPSFFNDITKYNIINRKIKNYYKLAKQFDSPEMAKIYLIDIKRLYEERDKI